MLASAIFDLELAFIVMWSPEAKFFGQRTTPATVRFRSKVKVRWESVNDVEG